MARRPAQLALSWCRPQAHAWATRRCAAPCSPVAHCGAPVHVTLRTIAALRCLRSRRVFPTVRRAIADSNHADFRIIEFSTQNDHMHFLVEAEHKRALRAVFAALPCGWPAP